jgi:hypothetical protein
MTRFTAAPRLVTHTRKRKQQKAEAQDAMTANDTREYIITTDGAVATPPSGQVSHYRTADGWRQKDDTGTASDAGALRYAEVTLTDAQIKSYSDGATSIPLVAAPGANKILRFVSGFLVAKFAGAPYTNIAAADASAEFRVGSSVVSLRLQNGTIGGTAFTRVSDLFGETYVANMDWFVEFPAFTDYAKVISAGASAITFAYPQPLDYLKNEPLVFALFNGDGDFTGGHADNSLKIGALYRVVDV